MSGSLPDRQSFTGRSKAVRSHALLIVSVLFASLFCVAGSGNPAAAGKPASHFLFDDFDYSNYADLAKNGWIVRTAACWPGAPGATWRKEGATVQADPAHPGNRIL